MILSARKIKIIMSILILLTGCQHKLKKLKIPEKKVQISQLSAMIASGQYIKKNCHRKDIPDATQLHQTALYLAQQRGWNTQAIEYQALTSISQARYQSLLQEGTSKEKKCAQLNSLMADFIYQAKRYKG